MSDSFQIQHSFRISTWLFFWYLFISLLRSLHIHSLGHFKKIKQYIFTFNSLSTYCKTHMFWSFYFLSSTLGPPYFFFSLLLLLSTVDYTILVCFFVFLHIYWSMIDYWTLWILHDRDLRSAIKHPASRKILSVCTTQYSRSCETLDHDWGTEF